MALRGKFNVAFHPAFTGNQSFDVWRAGPVANAQKHRKILRSDVGKQPAQNLIEKGLALC